MAVLNTGKKLIVEADSDGIVDYGHLETCVRPGYFDNSHVGSNGIPTKAHIGDTDVYIDITHGVYNKSLAETGVDRWQLTYLPFLRVKDCETGELLYYSEEPILDMDDVWKEYVQDGAWISQLPNLDGVIFAGGQIPVVEGRNGIDDEFSFYAGLGDTAIGRAVFKLRDLIPKKVIEDIMVRKAHRTGSTIKPQSNRLKLPNLISGWEWFIENDVENRCINIVRKLPYNSDEHRSKRPLGTVPGKFDADCVVFDGKSVIQLDGLGWILIYRGARWDEDSGKKITRFGYGIMVLDMDNPERLLYRSTKPLDNLVFEQEDWTMGIDGPNEQKFLARAEQLIPDQVKFEIHRMHYLGSLGAAWTTRMTKWLKDKAAASLKEMQDAAASRDLIGGM